MKNIFKTLSILALVLTFSSCQDSQNTVDDVLNYETGAILRTISVDNAVLNSSDPDSPFTVQVEAQDEQDGDLFAAVQVYVQMRDLTPDNGITPAVNTFVKSIPASEFSPGPVGLPRGTVSATFGEMTAAMGLSSAEYFPGDVYIVELRIELTDGRVYGVDSAGSSVTGGYFSSPFAYNALLTCTPEPGDYVVEMHDSYGDGWQTDDGNGGSGITVDITLADGSTTQVEVGMCSPYGGAAGTFNDNNADPPTGCTLIDCTPTNACWTDATATVTIPVGASGANWTFPGDQYGEISFEVYAPDGSLLFASGGPGDQGPGLLPVTFCLQ
ncbi:MAG: hypothetical protein KJP09_10645 [Bacteroidia bacterium]|nr:hypothetical protein [Bacteroidia bacterium]MBT8308780.1 hypothetical protein [Bacteroidia bacterium]NND11693.1 hypothetical protein [Flavobacteriaceae bacterium]NNK28613.1 hypothetical protein [Flavobacteriaceae bacterium]NNL61180.1 hypothetical protein [Flavobacteriaceae bacterium]